ncbi:isoleucine--tRNA ligase [Bombilactobacillus thymidiniphilus]|uniref:Isoleucine--tRNA ligase n=1 Tax=Bombilactobacillus thymidiniphilus TaxID=2923363 RepID=A0ABY4PE54_9LACO|nr:isoleucine--tRNA ligase [Bombilactobacillus thymidiniphilus]UQS83784.1 isoleucine--tRNA ligase [Bombilactobacillus thymidiniphilus]
MRIKDTLNLGKTNFPMRGNLPKMEPEWQKDWEENDIYQRRQKLNAGLPTFILHDGPPFANGNIHMGHAMNKISKDIVLRSKSMNGYRAPFVPGWDTHGLPIEQQLAKKGIHHKEMNIVEYRQMCRDFALGEIDKQRTDFKRLGVAADWDNPYITLQPEYEEQEIKVFAKMVERGLIYRGQKPVYWSPSSESTLAEAEVEYHDIKSPSLYVAFPVKDGKGVLDEDTLLAIWTTTPWTLPANEAVCVNPRFDYSVVLAPDGKKYVVAKERIEYLAEAFGWSEWEVLQDIKGQDLEYVVAKHPFYDRDSLVILGDHVTLDDGTGLVHTAPGLGNDDFNVGIKYNLDVLSPVDNQGRLTAEAPGFEGIFYDDANKMVTDLLQEKGLLLKLDFFTHSYPHDWRTKKPVIYRSTPQWFASIDPIRADILQQIKHVEFDPAWGQGRLYNMIKDRGDWVISRQRVWGVPLPIFYAENGEPIMTAETINHVAELFGKYGSDIWFEKSAKELLPDGFTHEGSPNGKFTKETDIMDVWFDSGSSHQAVLAARPELTFPADLYLEGSDQYRGWFNSSLITAVSVTGQAPYKKILSQGFTLDAKGHKMSKSLGNVIVPSDIERQFGAEIIRLWVASVDTSSDVPVSVDAFKQTSETYRKIRNTLRFMLANTADYDPKIDQIAYNDLGTVDQFIVVKLNKLIAKVLKAYDDFDFAEVSKVITSFIANEMSAFYLDFAKDILYIDAADALRRRQMQTVIYDVAVALTKLLTPILPHTMEQIWQELKEPEDYVQLAQMPKAQELVTSADILADWHEFMNFRDHVLKSLEAAREQKLIGKSMEAAVTIYPSQQLRQLLNKLNANVGQLLIVSQFEIVDQPLTDADQYDEVQIQVTPATGQVCARCRMIKADVGVDEQLPMMCQRCATIVRQNFPQVLAEGLEK